MQSERTAGVVDPPDLTGAGYVNWRASLSWVGHPQSIIPVECRVWDHRDYNCTPLWRLDFLLKSPRFPVEDGNLENCLDNRTGSASPGHDDTLAMKATARPAWLARVIWGERQTNDTWQRIVKASVAGIIAVIIAILPQVIAAYGLNTYLIPMVTVFCHSGQRTAKVVETLLLVLLGSLVGLGWSILGLHLSTLVEPDSASSSIRAVFFLVAVLVHGFVRSSTPRLFVSVWLLLVASATTLIGSATEVTLSVFTSIYWPILTGGAVVFVVNIGLFPEMSTSFLGSSTIKTLDDTVRTVERAAFWFITPGGDSAEAKKKQADSRGKDRKRKKKTWLRTFLADFPNPFKTTGGGGSSSPAVNLTTLSSLAGQKSKLREALIRCKSAQDEVNFEASISPLPSQHLKPISKRYMSSLVQNTVTIIGACENKYVLLNTALAEQRIEEGLPPRPARSREVPAPVAPSILHKVAEDDEHGDSENSFQTRIDNVKPLREIESGSADVLESVLKRLRKPVEEFMVAFKDAASLAITCIAYCYDVPSLPDGIQKPRGIVIEEVDIRIDCFADALARFDKRSTQELKMAVVGESGRGIELMPRMEMFLVSSFLLGFRQASTHVLQMLRCARELVDQRRKRNDRSRLWLPHYTELRQWLATAGELDAMVLPGRARREVRTGKMSEPTPSTGSSDSSTDDLTFQKKKEDEEDPAGLRGSANSGHPQKQGLRDVTDKLHRQPVGLMGKVRVGAADALEWAQHSDDLIYALKLAIAVFAVSWPSFVPSWRAWFGEVRGIWAPLQLVLVFEVSIGTSIFIFLIRLFGVIFGCVMGFASYEVARGHRAAMVVVLALGIIPCVYIQIATKYVKAGMIAITSMCVVAMGMCPWISPIFVLTTLTRPSAAVNHLGPAYDSFYKRFVAFLVGSLAAIMVEVFIYPVRARDRLLESLAASVRQVQNMHSAVSVGIDGRLEPNFHSERSHSRFDHARDKAQASLSAAETFLPFCLNEPRLKGSFRPLEPIYREIIYVLHQIIDRFDDVVELRKAYGSSLLEDLNAHVYAYRRNVAAANTLVLFSVHEALTTWLPLPQFIPSSRLAQQRLVGRVREILDNNRKAPDTARLDGTAGVKAVFGDAASFVTRRKFLAWNASAAGFMEIIEYLEELVELTKLLVGVNAFRSGLLERPQYKDYVEQAKSDLRDLEELAPSQSAPAVPSPAPEQEATIEPAEGESLRRVATVTATMQRFARRVRTGSSSSRMVRPVLQPVQASAPAQVESAVADGDEDEDEDEVPMSLRRVGTRLHRESTVVRRRGYSAGRKMS